MPNPTDFAIIGAGLAGCECALVLARHGFKVALFEQKPTFYSPAHKSANLAELVCSNSFRSDDPTSAVGMLKAEMRALNSAIMAAAELARVPADKALAVDRASFSEAITRRIANESNIALINRQIQSLNEEILAKAGPKGIILAAGPLASENLSASLAQITGSQHCYFYDAIAPIIWTDSLNMDVVFRASRHDQTADGDYLNCPMTKEQYESFYNALCLGKTFQPHAFEKEKHFEGCMPIEALAARGPKTLSFGPMKPIGLIDPATGKRPWAVLQLRSENAEFGACNLVGCQTKLLQSEQERIFRLIPGLEKAEFIRYGSMHRNTYVNAPEALNADLELKNLPGVYLAGQITGMEGYVESAACGLWLGLMLAWRAKGDILPPPPLETALGALLDHLQRPTKDFQPSNINFGLMPPLEGKIKKKERKQLYAARGNSAFAAWKTANSL